MAEAQKVAVVTGAGTGIGKAAAIALVKAGYAVALAGRRKEPLEETAKEAKGKTLVVRSKSTRLNSSHIQKSRMPSSA